MSTVKANNVQIGQSATATNNFVISVPAVPDGTMKIARGNQGATTQDILTVDASGVVGGLVQPALVSGTNIKTVGGFSLLGSGNVDAGGSLLRSARTSNTILGAADKGSLIDITSGTFTQTFVAAATLGDGWFCYIRNSGTGDVTLDPNGAETIDGRTSLILSPGDTQIVISDGSQFYTIRPRLRANSFTTYRSFVTSATFVAPITGNYSVTVIGGGGAGGRSSSTTAAAAASATGGGAGGLAKKSFFAVAGDTFTVTVGAGGESTYSTTAEDGLPGGQSSFVGNGLNLVANGGAGGLQRRSAGALAAAAGGSASGGDFNFTGGSGGAILGSSGSSTYLATGGGAVGFFANGFSSGTAQTVGSVNTCSVATGGAGVGGSSGNASVTVSTAALTGGGGSGGPSQDATDTQTTAGGASSNYGWINGAGGSGTTGNGQSGGVGAGGGASNSSANPNANGGIFGGGNGVIGVPASSSVNPLSGSGGAGGGGGGLVTTNANIRSNGAGGQGIVILEW